MNEPLKILMLEDSSTDAEIVQRLLKKEKLNFESCLAMNKENFLLALEQFQPDVILADNSLPQFNAKEALEITRQRSGHIPFIMVTGTVSEEFAANIIKSGADDYILKDRLGRLPASIEAAIKQQRAEKEKKDALENLIQNEEKYRTLIERISDAFIALDRDWRYTYVNKQAGELIHRDPESLIGKNVWDEFPDAVGSLTYKAFHTAMNEQRFINNIDYYPPFDLWQENHIYPSPGGLSVFIRNITEKKKAEQELYRERNLLRTVIDNLPDYIYVKDTKSHYIIGNRAIVELIGASSEKEIQGKTVLDLFGPEIAEVNFDEDSKVIALDKPVINRDEPLTTRSGKNLWLLTTKVPLKDEEGKITGLIGISRDITERKRAEKELQTAHDRLFFLVENSPLGFIEWDGEIRPRSWSKRAEEIFGWTEKEARSEQFDWFSKVYEEDLPRVSKMAEQLIAGEEKKNQVQHRNYTRDGRVIWCEWFNSVLKDKDGKVITILSLVQDITERKQAEEKIFKSEEQYRDLVDNITDLICTHDLDGRILSMNRAAEELIAHKFNPEENMNIKDILAPDEKYKFNSYITELKKTGYVQGLMKVQTFTGKIHIWEYSNSLKTTGVKIPIVRGYARDITESKKAEKELKKSEERLKEAQAIAHISNWEIDMVQNIHTWSDEFYRIYGLNKAEIQPSAELFLSFMHPDDTDYGQRKMQEAFDTLQDSSFQFRFIRKDGMIRYGRTEWKFEFDKDRKPIRLYGILQDITERKKAEEALSANELRFRTLTSNAPVGIFQTDAVGKTIYVNETWLNYTGLTFNEAMGDGWQEVLHPDDKEKQLRQWENRAKKGLESSSEFRILDKKGNTRWVIGKATPLFDKSHKITGYIGTLSDITESKKAEEALRQSEIRLNEAQAIAQVGNWEINFTENILTWSDESYNIYGINKNEVELSTELFLSFMHPDDAGLAKRKVQEAFDSLSDSSFNFRFIRKDGMTRHGYIEWKLEFDKNGKPLRLYGIIQDITERKKAEEELQQINEELHGLSSHLQNVREEERIQIARDIHDELGQQLTGLKMNMNWLNKKLDTEDELIQQKLNGMIELIDETVNSVRRISSNLRPSILDDLGLIAALEWHSQEVEKRAEIKVNFCADMSEPEMSVTMATGIFRIYQEALTNAVRHANAHEIASSLELKDNHLILKIKDDGQGMDPKIVGTKKTLGLIGIKERTFVLGGKYDLKSEPGKGTEVQVSIPL